MVEVGGRTPRNLRGYFVQCTKGKRGKDIFGIELRLVASKLLEARHRLVDLYATRVRMGAMLPDVLQILEAYEIFPEQAARLLAECPDSADCRDEFDELRERIKETQHFEFKASQVIAPPLRLAFDPDWIIRRNNSFIHSQVSSAEETTKDELFEAPTRPLYTFFEAFPPEAVDNFVNAEWNFWPLARSARSDKQEASGEPELSLAYRVPHYFCSRLETHPGSEPPPSPPLTDGAAVGITSEEQQRKWNIENVYVVSWLLSTLEGLNCHRFLSPGPSRFWEKYQNSQNEDVKERVQSRIIDRLLLRLRNKIVQPVVASLQEISSTLQAVSNATRHLCQSVAVKSEAAQQSELMVSASDGDEGKNQQNLTHLSSTDVFTINRRSVAKIPGIVRSSHAPDSTTDGCHTEYGAEVKPIRDPSGLEALSSELMGLQPVPDERALVCHVIEALGGLPADRVYIEHDAKTGSARLIALR